MTARALLLSSVATAALMGPAMALDAQAFVDRFTEVYKTAGYDFQFGPATLDGDTITIAGGQLSFTPDEPMVFDTEVTFSGVVENADGSYTADSVTIPDIDTDFESDPVGHLTITDIRVEGLYLPAGNPVSAVGLAQLYQNFSTGPISVSRDGTEVLTIDSFEAGSDFLPEFGTTELASMSSAFAINGISADLTSIGEDDAEAAEVIKALGLTTLNGNIYADMDWATADGRTTLGEFSFDFADIGKFDIRADLTGLTTAVLDQLYAMQAQMGDAEMTEEQAQAQMMSGMALMQGVSIVSASVRYDDASLAGKLLDFYAAQSGADRAAFVEGLKAMLPAMLAETGIPALTDIVVPPVSAFLDDPKSLEVKVAPPSPTSLLVLMAAAANPAGLITALGFGVEANTAAQ